MSQEQYNTLLSNLLREKRALAKLRVELEGRKGKLCRNRKEGEKEAELPQNKFEVLKSRVMQCGVEERVVRSMRMEVVRCFKCREEGHKYRECPVWIKRKNEEKAVRPMKGKAQQEE